MNCTNCSVEQDLAATRAVVERIERQLFGNGQPGILAKQQGQIDELDNWRSRMNGGMKVLGVISTATLAVVGLVLQSVATVKSTAAANKAELTQAERTQQTDAFENREAIKDNDRRQKSDASDNRRAISENAADSRARSKRAEAQQHSEANANREAFQRQGSDLRDVQASVAKKSK